MQLRQVLFSQGFGTRRECDALILHGLVQVDGQVLDDPGADPAAQRWQRDAALFEVAASARSQRSARAWQRLQA